MPIDARQRAVPVPLREYLNWKGVSWPERGIVGQVDPHGSSLPGEALPSDAVITIQDVPYLIPKTDSSADDLISCEGQRIALPSPCSVQEIRVLGFSVFGDYTDQIGLLYAEDEVAETRAFGLTDWFQYLPGSAAHFGEDEGIVLPYFLDDEGVARRPVALWIQRIPADPAMTLRELRLPENPFMYMMAITLIAT